MAIYLKFKSVSGTLFIQTQQDWQQQIFKWKKRSVDDKKIDIYEVNFRKRHQLWLS